MPKTIPVKAAEKFAKDNHCKQVIIFAWDGELTHAVSYGESIEDCAQAAAGANKLKKSLGWPESLQAEPPRVKALLNRIAELEAIEARYEALRSRAKEVLLDPRRANSDVLPDLRTKWELPVLICSGPVGGFMSFDEAVDNLGGQA